MALETATWIGELNEALPNGGINRFNELDNSDRLIKSAIKNTFPNALAPSVVNYVTATGTANAQAVTLSPAPASLINGMFVRFLPVGRNTGATTLEVNGLGALPLLSPEGLPLIGGELNGSGIFSAVYHSASASFILLNSRNGVQVVQAEWWGTVVGASSTDVSSIIHMARDYVVGNGGGVVELPRGTIYANVVMRTGFLLHGQGPEATLLLPYDPTVSTLRGPHTADAFAEGGNLLRSGFSSFCIDGRHSEDTVVNKNWAIELTPDYNTHVDQYFINEMKVRNSFNGMWLRGIETGSGSSPSFIQHLRARKLRFEAPLSTQEKQLSIEGVVIETAFVSTIISFAGTGQAAEMIASIGAPVNTPGRVGFKNFVLSKSGTSGNSFFLLACRGCFFDQFYFEGGNNCVRMVTTDEVSNVSFTNGTFTGYGAKAITGTKVTGLRSRSVIYDSGTNPNTGAAVDFSTGAYTDVLGVDVDNTNTFINHTGSKVVSLPSTFTPLADVAVPDLSVYGPLSLPTTGTQITGFNLAMDNNPFTVIRTAGTGGNINWLDNAGNFILSRPFRPRTNGDRLTLEPRGTKFREVGRMQAVANLTHTATGAGLVVDSGGYEQVSFNHASATTIADFAGDGAEYDGARLFITAATANTTILQSGSIKMKGGVDLALVPGVGYVFESRGGIWYEV